MNNWVIQYAIYVYNVRKYLLSQAEFHCKGI